ncbi:hypothetical protein BFP97_10915 [Roseivirga sp. 4D4]|uniref:hypothetical protein n=1 Tax=Roseivirga sp. 4D4 TaxID=1889784 RepID=UPI000853D8DD|nr:hypothetical protein [Roseivirga sp. 4D4]OEK01998.1 hypothetical protein BFP97_10915 [Roseivirga sp. 4D4]
MTTTNPPTMGTPLKKLKDLPKKIMTHMPFVIFRPHVHNHEGKTYRIMDYLYFYKNLVVTSPYEDGHYFDEMPPGNVLNFEATAFDKGIKRMVISYTYYFSTDIEENKLLFKMDTTEQVINEYNQANPKNPIAQQGYVNPITGIPMYFTEECEVVMPPPPPTE